jgi:hypothetical protein
MEGEDLYIITDHLDSAQVIEEYQLIIRSEFVSENLYIIINS